jgi:hypothetical protein
MQKYVYVLFVLLTFWVHPVKAEIIRTNQIEEIITAIDNEETLVLFNIAEVLMDTEMSLGTQAWRKYVRARVYPQLHDQLTLYVFQKVTPTPPESNTPEIIRQLQSKGVPVLAFTSRGRNEWYSTSMQGIDSITEGLLRQIGIDLTLTKLPSQLSNLGFIFADFYHSGIIYATNSYEKGEILEKLLELTHYKPSRIVFIDDKEDSLESVEAVMKARGIPFTGFAYTHTSQKHANFDPMIAHIQFEWLFTHNQLLSDEEANQIRMESYSHVEPEKFFNELIHKWICL